MKNRILIVEDSEMLSKYLEKELVENNFIVIKASTGEEGLEKIKESIPDAIVVDINLPKMSGMEMLEKFRLIDPQSTTPVIVFTNDDYLEFVEKAVKNNVVAFLTKSDHNPESVIKILKEKLSK
jgi:two-component system response regulator DegU